MTTGPVLPARLTGGALTMASLIGLHREFLNIKGRSAVIGYTMSGDQLALCEQIDLRLRTLILSFAEVPVPITMARDPP